MMKENYFDHTNKNNESPFDRMKKENITYSGAGENIAAGQTSAIFAHEAWMNSQGHRKNILGDYKYIGVGVSFGGYYSIYYTQNFYIQLKGNHTFNHPDISKLSESQIEDEILKCEEVLIKLTGKKPTLFRPPFGSYNENSLTSIANKLGYKIILWNTVDAKDWENPSANKIANTIIDNAKNGDIILLHDYGTENTVKALDILIPIMQQKGFKFVTVSQLINNK